MTLIVPRLVIQYCELWRTSAGGTRDGEPLPGSNATMMQAPTTRVAGTEPNLAMAPRPESIGLSLFPGPLLRPG
jgi:hypothetical protein